MSRAVTARRSAIRNATSESWRISLSVSCDTRTEPIRSGAWRLRGFGRGRLSLRFPRRCVGRSYGRSPYDLYGRRRTGGASGRDLGALEMLVRGAVVAVGE